MALNITRGIGFFTVCLALTSTAHGHLIVEGAGDFGNGALHPFVTLPHVLVILGLAMLLGMRVPLDLKTPLRILAPVSAVALGLTAVGFDGGIRPPVVICLALIIGSLVGLGVGTPRYASGLLCALAAACIGLDSGVEAGSTASVIKTLAGTWLAMNGAMLYLAVCASHGADKRWARTGMRILGSWIIAISLMVLAFSLRGGV